ncbi:MAG: ribose-phosphate diphosphokinase [archaeon]
MILISTDNGEFFTQERFEELEREKLKGDNGWLLFAATTSGLELGAQVTREYQRLLLEEGGRERVVPNLNEMAVGVDDDLVERVIRVGGEDVTVTDVITRFEDSETRPRLPANVAGSYAFVIMPTLDRRPGAFSVNDNLVQGWQLINTLKVNSAKRVAGIVPYASYSRQDQVTPFMREAGTARWVARMFEASGADDVVVYHPHTRALSSFYESGVRLLQLNGLDLFMDIFQGFQGDPRAAAIACDAGGAKTTVYFANAMGGIDLGIISKHRPRREQSEVLGVIGNLSGTDVALLTDDETVTFGTILNAVKALYQEGVRQSYVAISHNKLDARGEALLRQAHNEYGLVEVHFTDTIPQSGNLLKEEWVHTHPITERIVRVANRMLYDQSVKALFYTP